MYECLYTNVSDETLSFKHRAVLNSSPRTTIVINAHSPKIPTISTHTAHTPTTQDGGPDFGFGVTGSGVINTVTSDSLTAAHDS